MDLARSRPVCRRVDARNPLRAWIPRALRRSAEAESHQPHRGDPEDHRAAGLGSERREGAGLVRIAAGAERDSQNDVRDE